MNISSEIYFKTSRSGGKGGQNVNKVETAVMGYWHINSSMIASADQKKCIHLKLINRINEEGNFFVKSQLHRTQFANKQEVIKKMLKLLENALVEKKLRKSSKVSKIAIKKRLDNKKQKSEIKDNRRRVDW